MKTKTHRKCRLFLRASLAVAVVILLKFLAHWAGWEVISLNPLFSGIVAANIFLVGFLLTGVMADYKESERLPGELASSLESIMEEAWSLHRNKKAAAAEDCLSFLLRLAVSINDWFYRKASTKDIMDKLNGLGDFFVAFEPLTQANYIVRLKQEQANIRRILIRVHAVREMSFVSTGYLMAETTTVLLILGLILSKIDPFLESLFFVGIIVFLLVFLILLIRDLDNPFGFYESTSAEDVSLKPLEDLIKRQKNLLSE